jgi:phosphinothricin acetyltransferase
VIRIATPEDADAIAAIYGPFVAATPISFEIDPPSAEQMRGRIASTLKTLPWLVSLDAGGRANGYAYAGPHADRAAYRWSVNVSVYVRGDSHRRGIGRRLYEALFGSLVQLGYCEAFAGITLPNVPSVSLHQSMGFRAIGVFEQVGFKFGAWRDVGWWQKRLRVTDNPEPPTPLSS